MNDLIIQIVDKKSFFELGRGYAKNIIVGFASIVGNNVGIVANQPLFKSGAIDSDASSKAARFIRMCDCFNIPIITFVDTPGFIPGYDQEKKGIIKNGSKMIFAYASSRILKITVIIRKAYGGAYIAMNSKGIGADVVYSWPNAEVGIMAAENVDKVLNNENFIADDYKNQYIDVTNARERGLVDEIISPDMTRIKIVECIRNTNRRFCINSGKKYGNIRL